jgi:hypothetical protein
MMSADLQARFRLKPARPASRTALFAIAVLAALSAASPCYGQWKKTIDCPEGRVYQDLRQDAGRDEFCVLNLPGSLWVRDGPSRFWFSEGHFGEEGSYRMGRKVGHWRECDRFDRCQNKDYELHGPTEEARGIRPEIPVRFADGKYIFDFNTCWSTSVTHQTTDSFLELYIANGLIRCQVTYIPSTEKDRPAGNGGYFCDIPYAVGVREFDSLDLRNELPKTGLPQFCRQEFPELTAGGRNKAQAVAIWGDTPFIDAITRNKVHAWATLANAVDVECAAFERPPSGPERLTLRLNRYAEDIVLERIGKEGIRADACGGDLPFSPMATSKAASGRTLFTFELSRNPAVAARQRACIVSEIKLQTACASR